MGNCINSQTVSEEATKMLKNFANVEGMKTGTVDESDVVTMIGNTIRTVMENKMVPRKVQETEGPWNGSKEFYRVSTVRVTAATKIAVACCNCSDPMKNE